jgi:hypothetical protein
LSRDAMFGKYFLLIGFHEETALIPKQARFNKHDIWNAAGHEFHPANFT